MPWTLWRYITLEVIRLVAISTAVLVAVISFAAAVKPLADGKLGAFTFLKFLVYAIPPMLAYALPFASGFGATLAYHRLTQDNEILAAKAGGISHRRVLAPALVIGLGLAVMLSLLNEQVIPRFLTRMERLITQDVTQIMVHTIERGDAVRVGSTEIYADAIQPVPPERGSNVIDQYLLMGVVGVDLDEDSEGVDKVGTMLTARRAWLLLVPGAEAGFDEPDTLAAIIRFEDVVGLKNGSVMGGAVFTAPAFRVPNPFKDDPKFLTSGELRALRKTPEEMNWIDARRIALAREYAGFETLTGLRRRLREEGTAHFAGARGEDVIVRSAALNPTDGWVFLPSGASGRVEVEVYRPDGGGIDRYAARKGYLEFESVSGDSPVRQAQIAGLTFTLRLADVETRSSSDDGTQLPSNELPTFDIPGLTVQGDPMDTLRSMGCDQLLHEVAYRTEGPGKVEHIAVAAGVLDREVKRLQREITSKQQERMAMAVSCLVMVLTGAVTAMKLREALPLLVYLWSFFPALGAIILISSGQQMIHNTGLIGLPVLWGGVILLAVYTFLTLRVLQRH
ncbi:MAG: LptF/LptG family permease [Phycisphaerales bacterium]